MDENFVLKYGKCKGKSIAWIIENDPGYLKWAEENAPNLLKSKEPKLPTKGPVRGNKDNNKSITPNMNFWNEGPAVICKPYLQRIEDEKKKQDNEMNDEWNF